MTIYPNHKQNSKIKRDNMNNPFKCSICGQFIAYEDLDNGNAIHREITPDSAYTQEEWDTNLSSKTKRSADTFDKERNE